MPNNHSHHNHSHNPPAPEGTIFYHIWNVYFNASVGQTHAIFVQTGEVTDSLSPKLSGHIFYPRPTTDEDKARAKEEAAKEAAGEAAEEEKDGGVEAVTAALAGTKVDDAASAKKDESAATDAADAADANADDAEDDDDDDDDDDESFPLICEHHSFENPDASTAVIRKVPIGKIRKGDYENCMITLCERVAEDMEDVEEAAITWLDSVVKALHQEYLIEKADFH